MRVMISILDTGLLCRICSHRLVRVYTIQKHAKEGHPMASPCTITCHFYRVRKQHNRHVQAMMAFSKVTNFRDMHATASSVATSQKRIHSIQGHEPCAV